MTLTEAFWKIHEGLPRQAPGSDSGTRNMLRLAGGAVSFHTVLDIISGSGRTSLALAEQGLQVTAVSSTESPLAGLKTVAAEKNLTDKIKTQVADIRKLPFEANGFDLLWAEGTTYILGFEASLKNWGRLLRPGGYLVATECAWLTAAPSEEAKAFWDKTYPAMLTVSAARETASKCGFDTIHTYILPDDDWWTEYYLPLEKHHDELRDESDPAVRQAIEIGKAEIALRETHPKEYGYVGFVLKKR